MLAEFIRMELGVDKNSPDEEGRTLSVTDVSDREECVNHILESILLNMGHRLKGNDSQCRFSPHVVNTAMCLFLRAPGAYDELRRNKVFCFPSPRHLRSISSTFKVEEGGDPILYEILQEEIDAGTTITGLLMVDEVKLKNGVAYNAQSKEISGLVFQDIDIKKTYEGLLGMCGRKTLGTKKSKAVEKNASEKEKEETTTIYANQWRFKSTHGLTHNADFFYNNGSLNGNEIMRQFMIVVTSYEYIGVRIAGVVFDGGGGNASFARLLRGSTKVEGPWPSIDCVLFKNPVYPERNIALWLCGTHGMKAMRNSLCRSQPKKARDFVRGGIPFGWIGIIECWERDQKRVDPDVADKGIVQLARTGLVRDAVYLDNYSIMNARFAKQAFHENTISEMMEYVAKELKVEIDFAARSTSKWHQLSKIWKQLHEASCEKTGVAPSIKSTIATIEYQVACYGIYNERLLNRRWKLKLDNIEQEKETMKSILAYFVNWRNERKDLVDRENVSWSSSGVHYLAAKTHENLLLGIAGLFAYAEEVLQIDGSPAPDGKNQMAVHFVPGLTCSQSNLENVFSQVRMEGLDRVTEYPSGIQRLNLRNNIKGSKKRKNTDNAMYPREHDCTNEDVPLPHQARRPDPKCPARRIGEVLKRRLEFVSRKCAKVVEWHFTRQKEEQDATEGEQKQQCGILPSDFKHNGTALGARVLPLLLKVYLEESCFQLWWVGNRRFRGYLALSEDTEKEKWFEKFLDPRFEEDVDTLSRQYTGRIFHMLEDSIAKKGHGNKTVDFETEVGKKHHRRRPFRWDGRRRHHILCRAV